MPLVVVVASLRIELCDDRNVALERRLSPGLICSSSTGIVLEDADELIDMLACSRNNKQDSIKPVKATARIRRPPVQEDHYNQDQGMLYPVK